MVFPKLFIRVEKEIKERNKNKGNKNKSIRKEIKERAKFIANKERRSLSLKVSHNLLWCLLLLYQARGTIISINKSNPVWESFYFQIHIYIYDIETIILLQIASYWVLSICYVCKFPTTCVMWFCSDLKPETSTKS